MADLPPVTGPQLIKLLLSDGWTAKNTGTHGLALVKKFADGSYLTTVVPTKKGALPDGTLGAILGVKQTQLGKAGLRKLIEAHGL